MNIEQKGEEDTFEKDYWRKYKSLTNSSKIDVPEMESLAKDALSEGFLSLAYSCYKEAKNWEMMEKVVMQGLDSGVFENESEHVRVDIYFFMWDRIKNKVYNKYIKSLTDNGFRQDYPSFRVADTLLLAKEIVENYDLGLSIAKGGIFSGCVFLLVGLKTEIIQVERGDDRKIVKFIGLNNLEHKLESSRIILFDKDIVSGNTLDNVVNKIRSFNPKTLDVFFNYEPSSPFPNMEVLKKVGDIYFPGMTNDKGEPYIEDNFKNAAKMFREFCG
ncbi:MAG: hypothetical protein GF347_04415 [Candidatus Moranbacteria bacterium]|nr:hypothetical protein [Candidatus Moranbacteria bacterium]